MNKNIELLKRMGVYDEYIKWRDNPPKRKTFLYTDSKYHHKMNLLSTEETMDNLSRMVGRSIFDDIEFVPDSRGERRELRQFTCFDLTNSPVDIGQLESYLKNREMKYKFTEKPIKKVKHL